MGDYNDGIIPEPCLRLDFGFGQQYASVELGDGTGYVRVTDETKAAYARVADELKTALEENVKLRDRYDAYECKMDGLVSMLTSGLLSKSAATPNDVIYSVAQEEMTDELEEENAKLRDAMYTKAGKHALQHMDEDELRIWATQQSEYIEELRDLVEQYHSAMQCTLETGTWPTDPAWLEERMRELGIEVAHD